VKRELCSYTVIQNKIESSMVLPRLTICALAFNAAVTIGNFFMPVEWMAIAVIALTAVCCIVLLRISISGIINRTIHAPSNIRVYSVVDLIMAVAIAYSGVFGPMFSLQLQSMVIDPCEKTKEDSVSICQHPHSAIIDAYVVWDPTDEISRPFTDRSADWDRQVKSIDFNVATCAGRVSRTVRDHEFVFFASCN